MNTVLRCDEFLASLTQPAQRALHPGIGAALVGRPDVAERGSCAASFGWSAGVTLLAVLAAALLFGPTGRQAPGSGD